MTIVFDIRSNIESIPEYLDDIKFKAIVQAAKTAVNKTLVSTRKLAIKRIGLTYRLRPSGFSRKEVKDAMNIIKAKGNNLETLKGVIIFKGSPIPIIKFISGSKSVIAQKGIKIKKRRKLKAEIRPGKKVRISKGFIQKARSTQVFKRGKGEDGFKKQAVASIALIIMRKGHRDALLTHISRQFPRIFANQVQFRLDKLADKLSKAPFKKL